MYENSAIGTCIPTFILRLGFPAQLEQCKNRNAMQCKSNASHCRPFDLVSDSPDLLFLQIYDLRVWLIGLLFWGP